jgi:hypothetical protein
MQLNLAAFLQRWSSPYSLPALRANPGWLILASALGTCMGFLQIHSVWKAVVPARCQLAQQSNGNL